MLVCLRLHPRCFLMVAVFCAFIPKCPCRPVPNDNSSWSTDQRRRRRRSTPGNMLPHNMAEDKNSSTLLNQLNNSAALNNSQEGTNEVSLTHWPLGDLNAIVSLIGIFRSSHDNAFRWMPQDLTDDKSRLVQVMAWCHQATSHYLSQCWLSSLSPYDITRPQWVNIMRQRKNSCHLQMTFSY